MLTDDELMAVYRQATEEVMRRYHAGDIAGVQHIINRMLGQVRGIRRPPKSQRPRCGAMTRTGTSCQAPVVWEKGALQPRNGRWRIHGGSARDSPRRKGARP